MASYSPIPLEIFIRLNRHERSLLKSDHSMKCDKCSLKNGECQPCNYWERPDGADGYYLFKIYKS